MNGELYQIGLPIDKLSNVLMNWTCVEPRQLLVVNPSKKQEDYVVVETNHPELAAAIIRDVPEALVKKRNVQLKVLKL